MFDTAQIYKRERSGEEDVGLTAFPFLTGDVDVLCLCLYMFFVTTCVSDVMIGRSELRRRLGNTGISVRNTATRRCWKIY